jgi:CPA1 family monovalent cation:H+ antiporter
MTFFESLLVLLLAAVLLLQVSRRLSLPYPSLLALAGIGVALIPGAPTITIDPHTAMALFIAPVLLDAAYDFPPSAARKLWRPLVILAVVAVVVTAASVAWVGWAFAGLPIAAALVLGAIVAPPDAAAATAVLGSVHLPRRTSSVLLGESLFNDATALLLFAEALEIQTHGGINASQGLGLALAVPGGVLLGIVLGLIMRRVHGWIAGTLGDNLLQFLSAFLVWILAERLHLSAVLTVVAFAMTIARRSEGRGEARARVHSFAVWSTVVFVLNVVAFLLMGMQARTILGRMSTARLEDAAIVTGLVVVAITVSRLAVVMAWNQMAQRFASARGDLDPPNTAQGVLVAWSGMRGLITMATAFALPRDFPERDVVVLVAFGVVIVTLVVQGLTLAPLIRWLGLDRMEDAEEERHAARQRLEDAGTAAISSVDGREADLLRRTYALARGDGTGWRRYRELGLVAVGAERVLLEEMREGHEISQESYLQLQEAIDWRELTFLPDNDRQIEEA